MNRVSRLQERGLSLVELMIALAIGAVLVLGLVEVFAASRTAYQLSTGLARVQENGRFAIDFLQRDLRMAGHFGCVNDQARFLPENITPSRPALASTFLTNADQLAGNFAKAPEPLRFDVGLQGFDAKIDGSGAATQAGNGPITLQSNPVVATSSDAWDPALSPGMFGDLNAGTTGHPVQNSDIVVLRYFTPTGAQMTSFTPGASATLTFSDGARLSEGVSNPGLFGVTDCINAAVFNATTADLTHGKMTVALGGVNKSGLLGNQSFVTGQAMIYRAESLVYYVGVNGNGNPALYRLRYVMAPGAAAPSPLKEELVEGIESLQLKYGQDSRVQYKERPTGNIGSSAVASALTMPTDLPAPHNTPQDQAITAFRRVGLVQIGLVARSPERAAAAQRNIDAEGVTRLSALGVVATPPEDGRYRTVYEDSIALRNRLFGN